MEINKKIFIVLFIESKAISVSFINQKLTIDTLEYNILLLIEYHY
jgi:hypothetical protein